MIVRTFALVVSILAAATAARAQEVVGAQRVEIGSAIFGGGMLFVPSTDPSARMSRSYVVSGAATANINPWLGIEGDVGAALSRHEAVSLYGGAAPDGDTPTTMLASGNVVYNVLGSHRRFVPYASGGLGALRVMGATAFTTYGFVPKTTYLTESVGGGVRWFPIPHWGVRGDYQFLHVRNDMSATSSQRVVRSAHRIYSALVVTF